MNLREAKLFVARFETGDHSPEEYAAFLQWLEQASSDDLGVIADEHEALQERWMMSATGPSSEWVEQLEKKLDRADAKKGSAVVKRIYAARGFKLVAAASVFAVLAGGSYLWYLSSGRANNGVAIGESSKPAEVFSQSISNPKGAMQALHILADGSKVWLNAASVLKYPVSFNGKERNVELSGEAYFEVAKNADKPFRIKIRDAKIEVLGTEINVMAYEDEPVSKTTLVDGAIKVVRGAEEIELQPWQQVEIDYPSSGAISPIKLVKDVNKETLLSWKSGYMNFNNDELHTVMREIARCYDFEVKYGENIGEKRLTGSFSRKDNIHQILKQIEDLEQIHFKIEGKTITVS
jgi:ferric-dicitrate binding protein FerR (iron transport regulator)